MASTKKLLCRFFHGGVCNFGDICHYSHDPTNSVPIPEDVCIYNLRSSCMYGQSCLKVHKTTDEIIDDFKKNNPDHQIDLSPTKDTDSSEAFNLTTLSGTLPEMDNITNEEDDTTAANSVAGDNPSYASVASSNLPGMSQMNNEMRATVPLCKFFETTGYCLYANCAFIHGEQCDLCGLYCIHPFNKQQNNQHRVDCVNKHEESMNLSFALQNSKELACAICLEIILEKEPRSARRFGILENCTHVYCIDCIRKWRASQEIDKKNKRKCPQCRIRSDYVVPSEYFYEDKAEKQNLIANYKKALRDKHCKYFKHGKGKCPFDLSCFYKHEYPNGKKEHRSLRKKNPILPLTFPDIWAFFEENYLHDRDVIQENELRIYM